MNSAVFMMLFGVNVYSTNGSSIIFTSSSTLSFVPDMRLYTAAAARLSRLIVAVASSNAATNAA